jgi:beta-lactam-binding protein with PASTA domain
VPDLSKFTIDIVEKKTENLNLRFEISDSTAYNPDFPAYSVVDQNPKPGQLVKENRKIYLTINPKDYALVTIPESVIGNTIRQVKPTLVSLGFKIGKITKKPYMAEGEVLSIKHQDEEVLPGTALRKTSVIDIVIGDGSLEYGEEAPEDTGESTNPFDGDTSTESTEQSQEN